MLALLTLIIASAAIWAGTVAFIADQNKQVSGYVTYLYYAEKHRRERKQVESLIRKQSHNHKP